MTRHRVGLSLTREEADDLARRAQAHRLPVARYARAAALGDGHDPAGIAVDADAWWAGLTPARRAQLHAWVQGRRKDDVVDGQDTLPLIPAAQRGTETP